VDVHVEFTSAGGDQIRGMFRRFYPCASNDTVTRFVEGLQAALDGREVSMAALQHFFILNRTNSAAVAAGRFEEVIDEMRFRDEEKKQQDQDSEVKRQRGYVEESEEEGEEE